MKLNIEELAREAGAVPIHERPKEQALVGKRQVEAFARLIVERCAQETEKLQCPKGAIARHDNAWAWDTLDSAEAIRNLLED